MNALFIVAVLTAWPELPPDPALQWPELPPVQVVEVAARWPKLPRCQEPTSVEEEFAKPPAIIAPADSPALKIGEDGKLVRLPGPAVRWPHQGCLMCLGIHLERTHRIPNDYLATFGHGQWGTLHDNLHNEKREPAVKTTADGGAPPEASQKLNAATKNAASTCSGGACSNSRWQGLFRRR